MTGAEGAHPVDHLWIVGSGRLGSALAAALHGRAAAARITVSGRSPAAPRHPIFSSGDGRVAYRGADGDVNGADAVVIAVPDSAIAAVAARLTRSSLHPTTPVLHTSGALGSEPLRSLAAAGHPVGSLHPLAAVPTGDAGYRRLIGAWWAVEGDEAAAALARRIAAALEGRVLEVAAGAKPLYHAAAVFASNYVVTLLSVSASLLREAGVEEGEGLRALVSLAAGAVENVGEEGPAAALTGPVARGDTATVSSHLARLSGDERALYSVLARRTLELARERGLDAARAAELARLLEGEG